MDFEVDTLVRELVSRLEKKGYTAYLVGGCVRDLLLKKIPKDWDIATSALPEELLKIFEDFKIIPSGIKHGTVSLVKNRKVYEITTFRSPLNITSEERSIVTDLKARDFTINSMAYSFKDGILDPNNGESDLKSRLIKAVGNPDERFMEDPLRLLRAIRFSSALGFEIEGSTRKSIIKNAVLIKKVSMERIRDEFSRIIIGDVYYLRELIAMGLLQQFIPEFSRLVGCEQHNPHHYLDVSEHTLMAMEEAEPDLVLKLAMLLHDIGKPFTKSADKEGIDHFYNHTVIGGEMTEKILKRLHYSLSIIKKVVLLVRFHDIEIGLSKRGVRKAISKIGIENFPLLMKVKTADAKAQSVFYLNDKLNKISTLDALFEDVIRDSIAIKIKDLAIDGNDLISLGFSSGKEIGQVLKALLDIVIDDPSINQRDLLMKLAVSVAREKE